MKCDCMVFSYWNCQLMPFYFFVITCNFKWAVITLYLCQIHVDMKQSLPKCNQPDLVSYVSQLKTIIKQLQPTLVRMQQHKPFHISDDLATYMHVFIQHSAVKKPLQQPYDAYLKYSRETINILW